MSILSLEFIGFTIATVIIYYIIPLRFRWWVLLAASCAFYALAGWQGCVWLVLVGLLTFLMSLLQEKLAGREKEISGIEERIRQAQKNDLSGNGEETITDASCGNESPDELEKIWEIPDGEEIPRLPEKGWFSSASRVKKLRKLVLAVTIILPFAAMAFVKYYDAVRELITALPALALLLPLGLSYFTFQSVGYAVDIYRQKYPAQKNPFKYLLFISFFPQMTQGPISPYPQLMPQLEEGHRFNPDNFVMGAQLALWGFFKKMVIADRLADITQAINVKQKGWFILLTVIIYAIRLYADFSGGMDVIRGAAKMMGIDMVENFRRPFFSHSVAEYWRRWHISLGVWFRNYLFYPITTSGFGLALSKLGRKLFGKKAGRNLPATVSTIIIFFLIGIWHTANGNALIFGLYFGLIMGIELLLEPWFKKLKKKFHINEKNISWKIYTMIRTWILIIIPQYFAFTKDPATGLALLGNTFKNWDFTKAGAQFTAVTKSLTWYIAGIAFLIMLIVDIICEIKPDLNERLAKGYFFIRWPILILLIVAILVYGCYGTGYDPTAFLYTHF